LASCPASYGERSSPSCSAGCPAICPESSPESNPPGNPASNLPRNSESCGAGCMARAMANSRCGSVNRPAAGVPLLQFYDLGAEAGTGFDDIDAGRER
jgi:hypothetical protein